MGLTITEKIIANHANLDKICPGQLVKVKVDIVFANDVTGTLAIRQMERMGFNKVFSPSSIFLSPIHFGPNADIISASQVSELRNFAIENNIRFFEPGQMGIDNVFLCQEGFILPGDLVIGGDSHATTPGALGAFSTGMGSTDIANIFIEGETWLRVPDAIFVELTGKPSKFINGKDIILTLIGDIGSSGALYKSLEFGGEAIPHLNMDDRMTLCNMSVEAGAKNGIIGLDETTQKYVEQRTVQTWSWIDSDPDAEYTKKIVINTSALEPVIAKPYSPENVVPVNETYGIRVNQVVIGSCTNGKITDLRQAAEIFNGQKLSPHVRCIVIPATQEIYLQAINEGLIETFISAGCFITSPTCGPCAGFQLGILDQGEVCIATTPRNFRGRMGHNDSKIYISGPYVAAAAAVAGEIVHPMDI